LLPQVGNGNSSWTTAFSPAFVAATVGLDTVTGVEVTERYISGSARTVEFQGSLAGSTTVVTKSGTNVRTMFGLKSRYFDVGFGRVVPPPFADISETIHEADIAFLRERSIALPCDAGEGFYCPDDFMEREDMAAFLGRALDLPFVADDLFTDDDGLAFEADINRIGAAGITKGCNPPTNDRYCPASFVTRGQTAAFLVRAFGLGDGTQTDRFGDDDHSVFEADIDSLAAAGITFGCNPPANDRYCPARSVTRAEMASFIARALRTAGS
ncbi:MAG: hypothetical protein ACE5GC_02350, partial [Acidimicrobiia bacterium]